MISRFFIDRPVFACVISIVIVIAGLVAMKNMPVAQYPDITPPVVTVYATYPGASADVISDSIAAPLELQINGADHMIYMSSTSSSTGLMTLSVFFNIGTNPDLAQVDIQNRVNQALPQLPQSVQQQGVTVSKRSGSFLMVVGLYSPNDRYDEQYVANYANLYVLDAIKRVPGASQAEIMGMPDYAMRVWLKPDRLVQLGITASDVADAIRSQNQQFAVGKIGQAPTKGRVEQTFSVTTRDACSTPPNSETSFSGRRAKARPWSASRTWPAWSWDPRTTACAAASTARRRRSSPSTSSPAPTRWKYRTTCAGRSKR
jgi:multidrug efflux pump